MMATPGNKGKITLPLALRQRLDLKAGDQREFDENASVLTVRRVAYSGEWDMTIASWQASAAIALQGHPWENETSSSVIEDLRGGPVEPSSDPL